MNKQKDLNYYRGLLHKDSVVLLVISIIFIIIILLFVKSGNVDDKIGIIFLKSVLITIFSIILICNKKETKKFIGILTIIVSCLMMLTSIGDGSLFGIVYFILGIFLIIHSILYLKKYRENNVSASISDKDLTKNDKMKYLFFIPIILTIILIILGVLHDKILFNISWYIVAVLVINIISIIFSILYSHKKEKSAFVYVMLVIFIIITTFSGLTLVDEIRNENRNKKYYNSEEFLIETAKFTEKEINEDITNLGNLKKFNIDITKENIITLEDYLSAIATNEVLSNNLYSLDELKEHGYTCKGYTILNFKDGSNADEYYDSLNIEYYETYYMKRFFDSNTYLNCIGKYSYTTPGYNNDFAK